MQVSLEHIVWFNEFGKKNSLANMEDNALTIYRELMGKNRAYQKLCQEPTELT